MKYAKGEIFVCPKTIYWLQMPPVITDSDKIEFLKQDVMLAGYSGKTSDIKILAGKNANIDNVAYFFNLDGILLINHIKEDTMENFLVELVGLIKSISIKKCVVYTTIINNRISSVFKREKIIYLEKNLNDKKTAFSAIFALIKPLFAAEGKAETRAFLRLNLLASEFKASVSKIGDEDFVAKGYLKDLSLNGMCLVFEDEQDFNEFHLKDFIEVKIGIKSNLIKINKALVTRVDSKSLEIGINYNVNNKSMVKDDDSLILTGLIYKWINEILLDTGYVEIGDTAGSPKAEDSSGENEANGSPDAPVDEKEADTEE